MRWKGRPRGLSSPHRRTWQPWFAWRPVRTVTRIWVWLEWIERAHWESDDLSAPGYVNSSGLNYGYRAPGEVQPPDRFLETAP